MTERENWLSDSLQRYLDRRSIPHGLKDKPEAVKDEVRALSSTLFRVAPERDYREWWDVFVVHLGEGAQTRAWPTQGEIVGADKAARKSRPASQANVYEPDPMAIAAQRIREGEAVGQSWLWGPQCRALQRAHGISEADLRPYRSALFFAEKELRGKESAEALEYKRKDDHATSTR